MQSVCSEEGAVIEGFAGGGRDIEIGTLKLCGYVSVDGVEPIDLLADAGCIGILSEGSDTVIGDG